VRLSRILSHQANCLPTNSEMEYLIRFVHQHEPFRKPEIDSLAELCKINLRWISYSDAVRRFSL
jgi:hypothetical protein